jgi:hypothetical protein
VATLQQSQHQVRHGSSQAQLRRPANRRIIIYRPRCCQPAVVLDIRLYTSYV